MYSLYLIINSGAQVLLRFTDDIDLALEMASEILDGHTQLTQADEADWDVMGSDAVFSLVIRDEAAATSGVDDCIVYASEYYYAD